MGITKSLLRIEKTTPFFGNPMPQNEGVLQPAFAGSLVGGFG